MNNRISKTLGTILFILLMTACGNIKNTADYGDPIYKPHYAKCFEIYSAGEHSSILRILNPWQGAENITKDLFISRNGELPPDDFTGECINTNPESIICMSTSHIAFIDAVTDVNKIKGVSGKGYVSNPIVVSNITEGKVSDIGYDTNINYEMIASIKPDIALIYGVAGENTAMTDKLKEMNITAFYICDYLEEAPLGKSEWVVAIGEIFDCREKAEQIFNNIEKSYNTTKELASQYKEKPKVMLNAPYRDTWFVPGDRSYMVTLINDAGGEYLCRGHDNTVSRPLSSEAAYLYLSQADKWLNPNQAETLEELKSANAFYASTNVVKQREVYNSTKRITPMGGSDFWESGALRADIVLTDMLQIMHPESNKGRELYYFKHLE